MADKIRTYTELCSLNDFNERYQYLRLKGHVGLDTFGFDRVFNQKFYMSNEWRQLRQWLILRDNGCDLAMQGHPIPGRILIHHMNPITIKDIESSADNLLNPEYLVCVSLDTHNAIHYGLADIIERGIVERYPNDTTLWRRK